MFHGFQDDPEAVCFKYFRDVSQDSDRLSADMEQIPSKCK